MAIAGALAGSRARFPSSGDASTASRCVWPPRSPIIGLAAGPVYGGPAHATSGPSTAPLVELYLVEGCSSCPPADRWLSTTFREDNAAGVGIALAFHVDSRTVSASKIALRRRRLPNASTTDAAESRSLRVQPQVLVQGRDFPEWRDRRAAERIGVCRCEAPAPRRDNARSGAARRIGRTRASGAIVSPARPARAPFLRCARRRRTRVGHQGGGERRASRARPRRAAAPREAVGGRERRDEVVGFPALAVQPGSASTVVAFVQKPAPAMCCRR